MSTQQLAPDEHGEEQSPSPRTLDRNPARTSTSPTRRSPARGSPSRERLPASASSPALSGPMSLQAAARLNAGMHSELPNGLGRSQLPLAARSAPTGPTPPLSQSPRSGRGRSTVLMSLQLSDPMPAPGEMVSDPRQAAFVDTSRRPSALAARELPHHTRAMSLGELHQQMEAEQESQVLHLLYEIHQIQAMQGGSLVAERPSGDEAARSARTSAAHSPSYHPSVGAPPRSPAFSRGSFQGPRSRGASRADSPLMRAPSVTADHAGVEQHSFLGGRDESAFYQAETQMLVRENQMLRHRIRELERQIEAGSPAAVTHEPPLPSHLISSQSASEDAGDREQTLAVPAASSARRPPRQSDSPRDGRVGQTGS